MCGNSDLMEPAGHGQACRDWLYHSSLGHGGRVTSGWAVTGSRGSWAERSLGQTDLVCSGGFPKW